MSEQEKLAAYQREMGFDVGNSLVEIHSKALARGWYVDYDMFIGESDVTGGYYIRNQHGECLPIYEPLYSDTPQEAWRVSCEWAKDYRIFD